jgi:hypothetical protein
VRARVVRLRQAAGASFQTEAPLTAAREGCGRHAPGLVLGAADRSHAALAAHLLPRRRLHAPLYRSLRLLSHPVSCASLAPAARARKRLARLRERRGRGGSHTPPHTTKSRFTASSAPFCRARSLVAARGAPAARSAECTRSQPRPDGGVCTCKRPVVEHSATPTGEATWRERRRDYHSRVRRFAPSLAAKQSRSRARLCCCLRTALSTVLMAGWLADWLAGRDQLVQPHRRLTRALRLSAALIAPRAPLKAVRRGLASVTPSGRPSRSTGRASGEGGSATPLRSTADESAPAVRVAADGTACPSACTQTHETHTHGCQ